MLKSIVRFIDLVKVVCCATNLREYECVCVYVCYGDKQSSFRWQTDSDASLSLTIVMQAILFTYMIVLLHFEMKYTIEKKFLVVLVSVGMETRTKHGKAVDIA